ncbi:MAG: phosphatase PAP2 family protein [Polymorphobacter sp.]
MRKKIIAITLGLTLAAPAAASDKFWRTFADVGAIGIPVAAGVITLDRDDRNGLFQLTETGFVAILAAEAMKYSINSERPNGGDHSFPSGHTTLAFSGAGYLHARYGWKTSLPFEILAAGVGFARVQSHDHHWYDVVAGAAIGEGSAFLLTKRLREDVRVSVGGDTSGGVIAVSAKF